jgi:hypothetical protein
MKEYKVIRVVNYWSASRFLKQLEETLNKKVKEGWIVDETKIVHSNLAYIVLSKLKNAY